MTLSGCALLAWASPLAATTYHVAPDSSGDVLNIQAAIDAATSGDEIVLSDGTFTGDGNWDLDFGTKEAVLRSVDGYEATTIDGGFDYMHEIRHRGVILNGGQTAATRIEGITIQLCRIGELDGGAIWCPNASPTIRNVRMRSNDGWGRGVDIFSQGSSTIVDCVFEPNLHDYNQCTGAAIYANGPQTTIQRCSFTDMHGVTIVSIAGGSIEDCAFEHMRGPNEQFGDGLWVSGGQVSIRRSTFAHSWGYNVAVAAGEVLIESCLFEHNYSDLGACVVGGGTIAIRNTTFRDNGGDDAIISFGGARLSLHACVFLNNHTCYFPIIEGRSSALYADGASLHVSHCTFVRNRNNCGRRGSAITIGGGVASIDHTIIAFGGQAGLPDGALHCTDPSANLSVSCSDFFGNEGGDWTGCVAGMESTNGNISADPLFCDIAAGDVSLQADSPCAPANSGECGLIGALGPWCGPLALEPHSWGSIKALYR